MIPVTYEEFYDEVETIPDETVLYRRVDWNKIGGMERSPKGVEAGLNDNCFTDWSEVNARQVGMPGPCMSVGLSTILELHGKTPAAMIEDRPGDGVARMTAGALRALKRADGSPCPQGIMLCPTEREPWHGVVFDLTSRPRGGAVRKAVARIAMWEIPLINHDS
jgi:hypothetical protein